jgi:hypothetical protein
MAERSDRPTKPLRFVGFRSPRYTQVPDELFDELLPYLSGAELKVLLYIVRRTFGFKRDSDNIALSQMLKGIVTADGRRLDRGVGLSKPTLLKALRDLAEKNIIVPTRRQSRERGDESTNYRLNIIGVDAETPSPSTNGRGGGRPPVVKEFDQGGLSSLTTPLVKEVHQGLVKKVAPQETGRQQTEHTRGVFSPSRGTESESARALVTYFHKQARHPESQRPTRKELQQSAELITAHGEERARAVVDYALTRASETNFRMQYFGGVLLSVPQALEALEKAETRRRVDRERQARQRAEEQAQRAAFERLPLEQRIAGHLEAKIMMFKLKTKRHPTEAEIEAMRQELLERREQIA